MQKQLAPVLHIEVNDFMCHRFVHTVNNGQVVGLQALQVILASWSSIIDIMRLQIFKNFVEHCDFGLRSDAEWSTSAGFVVDGGKTDWFGSPTAKGDLEGHQGCQQKQDSCFASHGTTRANVCTKWLATFARSGRVQALGYWKIRTSERLFVRWLHKLGSHFGNVRCLMRFAWLPTFEKAKICKVVGWSDTKRYTDSTCEGLSNWMERRTKHHRQYLTGMRCHYLTVSDFEEFGLARATAVETNESDSAHLFNLAPFQLAQQVFPHCSNVRTPKVSEPVPLSVLQPQCTKLCAFCWLFKPFKGWHRRRSFLRLQIDVKVPSQNLGSSFPKSTQGRNIMWSSFLNLRGLLIFASCLQQGWGPENTGHYFCKESIGVDADRT